MAWISISYMGERGETLPHVKDVLEKKLRETERNMEEISVFRDSLLYYRVRFEKKEDQGQH